MKSITLSLLALLTLLSCQPKEQTEAKQKTIICGQVSNFDQIAEHDFIELFYQDLLEGQIKRTEDINEKGEFRFELDLDYPAEFYLNYSGLLTYYMSPGDSLFFAISEQCKLVTTHSYAEEAAFYKVSGSSMKMNTDLEVYEALYRAYTDRTWALRDSMIKTCTPDEYRSFIEDSYQEWIDEVAEFNIENNISQSFQKWIANELKFAQWEELMRYRWMHPYKNKKDINAFMFSIPDEYYNFLDDWDKANKKQLEYKSYLGFLHEYHNFNYQKATESLGDDLELLYTNNFSQFVDTLKKAFIQEENRYMKDVLISKLYFMFLNSKEYHKIKDVFDASLIEDMDLRKKVQEKYDYERNLYENPKFAAGSKLNQLAVENDFIQELIKSYPDKVLYLDFWAPWCGPCMEEMPYAKNIKKQLEGKDVVFVYLANRCEEASWKATIAEKKIEGEHYRLTDKQFAHLSEIFSVTGIPHFAIIDKSGHVANEHAPRPSSGDQLVEMLDGYLN